MDRVKLGGLMKHSPDGYGFKVTCENVEDAQKIKGDLLMRLPVVGYEVHNTIGYHDKEARR